MLSIDIGGGGNAFGFEKVGDTVTGKILDIEEQQQTDMDTGAPAFWETGQPKNMYKVELQTTLRDPANPTDDGKRSVYLRGSKKAESRSSLAAVLVAVKAATGSTRFEVGADMSLSFIGEGVATRRGYNPPKMYSATYAPPAVDLAPPVQQQPAWAPQPQPAWQPAPPQQAPVPAWVPQPAVAQQVPVQQAPIQQAIPIDPTGDTMYAAWLASQRAQQGA